MKCGQSVANKKNKQWKELALDIETKEIVGVYIGERSRNGAQGLWQSLPALYRQCAVCYTEVFVAYEEILPESRHRAVGKKSGKTNLIERFNCTLRQRVSRKRQKNPILFQKARKPHRGYLVFHPSLQRTMRGFRTTIYPLSLLVQDYQDYFALVSKN